MADPFAGNRASNFHPGAPAPTKITNNYYLPDRAVVPSSGVISLTTTLNRLYFWPHYIPVTQAYQGMAVWNSGAGDNGKKIRLGAYSHSSSGPTTLLIAFGEITLTGAAAERLLSSSYTFSPGWIWLCAHFNAAAAMSAMAEGGFPFSNVGWAPSTNTMFQDFGIKAPVGADPDAYAPAGYYVDTAYGALASTAVPPTATLAATSTAPAMALKV